MSATASVFSGAALRRDRRPLLFCSSEILFNGEEMSTCLKQTDQAGRNEESLPASVAEFSATLTRLTRNNGTRIKFIEDVITAAKSDDLSTMSRRIRGLSTNSRVFLGAALKDHRLMLWTPGLSAPFDLYAPNKTRGGLRPPA